jgi:hypothetical protein
MIRLPLLLFVMLVSLPAFATDGVLEIDQFTFINTSVVASGRFDGNLISGNGGCGLFTQDLTALVKDNTFYGNGGTGLGLLTAGGGYGWNTLGYNNGGNANDQGDGSGAVNQLGAKVCGQDATCP